MAGVDWAPSLCQFLCSTYSSMLFHLIFQPTPQSGYQYCPSFPNEEVRRPRRFKGFPMALHSCQRRVLSPDLSLKWVLFLVVLLVRLSHAAGTMWDVSMNQPPSLPSCCTQKGNGQEKWVYDYSIWLNVIKATRALGPRRWANQVQLRINLRLQKQGAILFRTFQKEIRFDQWRR